MNQQQKRSKFKEAIPFVRKGLRDNLPFTNIQDSTVDASMDDVRTAQVDLDKAKKKINELYQDDKLGAKDRNQVIAAIKPAYSTVRDLADNGKADGSYSLSKTEKKWIRRGTSVLVPAGYIVQGVITGNWNVVEMATIAYNYVGPLLGI